MCFWALRGDWLASGSQGGGWKVIGCSADGGGVSSVSMECFHRGRGKNGETCETNVEWTAWELPFSSDFGSVLHISSLFFLIKQWLIIFNYQGSSECHMLAACVCHFALCCDWHQSVFFCFSCIFMRDWRDVYFQDAKCVIQQQNHDDPLSWCADPTCEQLR